MAGEITPPHNALPVSLGRASEQDGGSVVTYHLTLSELKGTLSWWASPDSVRVLIPCQADAFLLASEKEANGHTVTGPTLC